MPSDSVDCRSPTSPATISFNAEHTRLSSRYVNESPMATSSTLDPVMRSPSCRCPAMAARLLAEASATRALLGVTPPGKREGGDPRRANAARHRPSGTPRPGHPGAGAPRERRRRLPLAVPLGDREDADLP